MIPNLKLEFNGISRFNLDMCNSNLYITEDWSDDIHFENHKILKLFSCQGRKKAKEFDVIYLKSESVRVVEASNRTESHLVRVLGGRDQTDHTWPE